jgi:fructose-bisphosphate aldolase/6-deoxy-5-ketofructose 1-phosphate synthase
MKAFNIDVPADVPQTAVDEYVRNYRLITRDTGKLVLFSVDQKIEHLNDYFFGANISPEDNDPAHLFKIADAGFVGAMATHLGLIARYANHYKNCTYIAKLNSKTHLVPIQQKDPESLQLYSVADVVKFKKNSGIPIVGAAYTLYPGSEYESSMLSQAAHAVLQAHEHGLVVLLFIYPRGKAVKNDHEGTVIAGAAGLGVSLGADFVKINVPTDSAEKTSLEWLKIAVQAAGNTKIICAGGQPTDSKKFLSLLHEQMTKSGTAGCATGRNIHQKSLHDAINFTKALNALVYENKPLDQVLKMI